MNILILGASGYIGRNLKYFLEKNTNATVSEFPSFYRYFESSQYMDIESINSIIETKILNADVIVHLYGTPSTLAKDITDPKESLDYKITKKILEYIKISTVKTVIYISSIWVYGDILKLKNINENTYPNPLSSYGKIKKLIEDLIIQKSNIGFIPIIFRCSNIYGYDDRATSNCWNYSINQFCKQGLKNKCISLNTTGKQHRDNISLNNILNVILYSINNSEKFDSKFYNVTSFNSNSVLSSAIIVSERIDNLFGFRPEITIGNKCETNDIPIYISNTKLLSTGFKIMNDEINVIDDILLKISKEP